MPKIDLKQDDYYDYKIIHESWNKDGVRDIDPANVIAEFKPSLRFFNTLDSNQILQSETKKENN